ncbi:MAG TPA: hydroxyisourate hydrolase [Candidatus Limnocylindrales bacterium]|nr:hydroxyisourate hydrolase [Candidatus Limnocylindrales bacterium]
MADRAAGTIPARPTISTHLLDTGSGRPAAGVHVTLHRLADDGRPLRLTQALTDDDGRVRDLLDRPLAAGTYRLEVSLAGRDGFFERLAVDIRVADTSRSYHVPVLLAPFSVTSYRGS